MVRTSAVPPLLQTAVVGALVAAAGVLLAPRAAACGAPFGSGTQLEPDQVIVVTHLAGVERYQFNPSFCGNASDFGLFLPIPAPLAEKPVLGNSALRAELDELSKPESIVEQRRYCPGGSDGTLGAGPPLRGGDLGRVGGVSNGVDVVDAGQVGFLEYEVLKADSREALTSFLDENHYPHDESSTPAFAHYVNKGFYLVAFKIATGEVPRDGKPVCGSLGPISLAFPTAEPLVPTRIVTDKTEQRWRIYTISDVNRTPTASWLTATPFFSGGISEADLLTHPALAALAMPGSRLTRHDVVFSASLVDSDLPLPPSATPSADFRLVQRSVEQVPDESVCDNGCAASPTVSAFSAPRARSLAALGMAFALLLARRHRSKR